MWIIDLITSLFLKTIAVSLMITPVLIVALAVRAALARAGVSSSVRYRLWALPAAALVIIALCAAGVLSGVRPSGAASGSAQARTALPSERIEAEVGTEAGAAGVNADMAAADMTASENSTAQASIRPSDSATEGQLTPTHANKIYNAKEMLASGIFGSSYTSSSADHSSALIAAAFLWLTGMIAVSAAAAVSCINVRRRTRFAVKVDSGEMRVLPEDLKNNSKKFNHLDIYESSALELPFTVGIFRPKVYLPAGMESDDAVNVLAHEAEHIRRKDCAVLAAVWACCAIGWFYPLLWIVYAMLRRDMEMSCDEAVTASMNRECTAGYMNTMLRMGAPGARNGRTAFAPGFAAGESDVEMRVKNITKKKKKRPLVTAAAVVICIAVAVGCVYGYSWYQAKYFELNDTEMLTADEVVKLLKVNGIELTPDGAYDADKMAVDINGYSYGMQKNSVPAVYDLSVGEMKAKVFLYTFDKYITYGSDVLDIPYSVLFESDATNDSEASDTNDSMWQVSIDDSISFGKNILILPYISNDEFYKGLNVDSAHYYDSDISESDIDTIISRSSAFYNIRQDIHDVMFYKAFNGTDTIYAGISGDWRFAFPVKLFSLSYTDSEGRKSSSEYRSSGNILVSYNDGDPTERFGSVTGVSVTAGSHTSSQSSNSEDGSPDYAFEKSDAIDGMYSSKQLNFAGDFEWYADSLDVDLSFKDGSHVTAECTDIE